MQENLLEADPALDLRVFVVWMPVLPGDGRARWDPGLLPDGRVHHYWDEGRLTGEWFAEHVTGGFLAWDVYFRYGPEAVWRATPMPLLDSASPVIAGRERLSPPAFR